MPNPMFMSGPLWLEPGMQICHQIRATIMGKYQTEALS